MIKKPPDNAPQTEQLLTRLWCDSQQLINNSPEDFPVMIFHCREIQSLHRVHFYQPTLLLILKGVKQIEAPYHTPCGRGNLLLVPAGSEFPFSNIPDDVYTAIVIGFQTADFPFANGETQTSRTHSPTESGTDKHQALTIAQAPDDILIIMTQLLELRHLATDHPQRNHLFWQQRRKELAQLLTFHQLDHQLRSAENPGWTQKLTELLQSDLSADWQLDHICNTLAISESSLRRKLRQENTGFRELLEDLRLNQGLGLLQTTAWPVNQVALACGYQSASRFTERFRKRFLTTPAALRKAR